MKSVSLTRVNEYLKSQGRAPIKAEELFAPAPPHLKRKIINRIEDELNQNGIVLVRRVRSQPNTVEFLSQKSYELKNTNVWNPEILAKARAVRAQRVAERRAALGQKEVA